MEFQVNSVRTMTRILALTWFLAAAAPSNEPTITTSNSTVVLRGQDALLTCTAKHLGKEVLDWVFEIDDTLIYHDQQLMVDDPRYSLLHTNDSDRYDLRITSVQDSDQGSYRCEVFLSVGVTIDLVVTDAEVPLEPSKSSTDLIHVKPDPPRNVTLIQTFNNGSYGIVVTWKPPADRPWTVAGYRISYATILDRWPRSTCRSELKVRVFHHQSSDP
ncbi:uncharacterized protein LOC112572756 isoform X1 [Pomacea canaliculata]|uniref:uncharacterized protein LOC112572756 isoform X1 n=1 Tax=Pomacea canaliculata TaxID=400727 RepID=UPI000D726043|nr:uncharacterized protein LOC112572756 isoform X1 [Pomacea canaliculata]